MAVSQVDTRKISIHLPRVGQDMTASGFLFSAPRFQSTCPEWGRTCLQLVYHLSRWYFNPPAPSGAGPVCSSAISSPQGISIHLPRVGQDADERRRPAGGQNFNPPAPCGAGRSMATIFLWIMLFQSTCPVWGRTKMGRILTRGILISIHLPRVGQDV